MTEQTADLRDEIAEALMSWAERNANPQYASLRRPETVRQNAYGRADAVLAVLAARTAAARQTIGPTCAHCKGTGADPEDQGDYDPNVHMYNPTTIGPCPECHGTGKDAPAVGQLAEAQATDEVEILARAASDLCAFGHGEAAAFLRDRIKAITEPGTWVPQYGRPLSPDEQDTETQAAADTVEDER